MALCNPISAITFSCLNSSGGVSKIYVTNFENVSSYTENSVGTVTAVTMTSGAHFVEIQSTRDMSAFEEDEPISIENGTNYWIQKVDVFVPRRDAAKRNAILLLSQGQPKLAIIVLDLNGTYWFVGLTQGAYLTSNKGGTGKKKADANAYQLEFIAEEPIPAPTIDPSVISAIIS
jgi:hypothetical protein